MLPSAPRRAVSLDVRRLGAQVAGGLHVTTTKRSSYPEPAATRESPPSSPLKNLREVSRSQQTTPPPSPLRRAVSNTFTSASFFATSAANAAASPTSPSSGSAAAAAAAAAASASPSTFGTATRTETDLLGSKQVPSDALYGIATQRAFENYDITGVRLDHYPEFIRALGMTKKACARANHQLGLLPPDVFAPIDDACDEVIAGKHDAHFICDMIQGGAGTSTNMNINEVVANVALQNTGREKGDYASINPNDHVNLCQSTNDAYPSAAKIAVVLKHRSLVQEMRHLVKAMRGKGAEFDHVVKMGRTQLQDAVPMTLGQEFNAMVGGGGMQVKDGYRIVAKCGVEHNPSCLMHDLNILENVIEQFYTLNLGGTAIGTGICADERFASCAIEHLSEITGLPLKSPEDFIEATSSTGSFLLFSGILRRVSVKLSKICNDLRLLASGPRCGFGEINLPSMAPGSSIMPGKINPVIPEVVNQVCFQVIGHDVAITMASEAGQLQLNVFEPLIVYNLLQSMDMLTRGMTALRVKCVQGVTANEERCRELAHNSIGVVTALLPHIGYKRATAAAALALKEGTAVADAVVELGFATREEVDELLRPERMTTNKKLGRVCIDTASALEQEVAVHDEAIRQII